MIKEDFIAQTLEKYEIVFNQFISFVDSNQNIIKKRDVFFHEKIKELPVFIEKIFNLIDNSKLKNLINEKDIDNFKIVSDGEYEYQVTTLDNEVICKLNLNISIREKFDAPSSEYPMSARIGEIIVENNKLLFNFYENTYKSKMNENIQKDFNKRFQILLSYNHITGIEYNNIKIKSFDIRNIKDDKNKFFEDIEIEFGIPLCSETFNLKNIDNNYNEYIFEIFKEKIFEKVNLNTVEKFNDFVKNVKYIRKYIKSLGVKDCEVNLEGVFKDYLINKENVIRITDEIDGELFIFYVKSDINDIVKGFSEKRIYTLSEESYSAAEFKETDFKLKDYARNRNDVLGYLKMLKY